MESGVILLRRRSGRYGGLAVGLLLGAGPLVAGVVGLAQHMDTAAPAFWRGLLYFGAASLPGLIAGGVIALCRSELYLDPARRAFRLVSHRPWRRARVEEIPLGEYAGVRVEGPNPRFGGRHVVYLVDATGEEVPIQMFRARAEAEELAERLGKAANLWVR